jgi:hypothetical protein
MDSYNLHYTPEAVKFLYYKALLVREACNNGNCNSMMMMMMMILNKFLATFKGVV